MWQRGCLSTLLLRTSAFTNIKCFNPVVCNTFQLCARRFQLTEDGGRKEKGLMKQIRQFKEAKKCEL